MINVIIIFFWCVCAIALAASEVSYQPYPNILFMVHFMLKAGEVICETSVLSQTSLASDASLQEKPAKSFSDTVGNTRLNFIYNTPNSVLLLNKHAW